jgi:hypothetical protein
MRRRQKRDSIEIVSTISASIIDAFGTIRPIISDGSGRKSSQTEPVSPTLTNPLRFRENRTGFSVFSKINWFKF